MSLPIYRRLGRALSVPKYSAAHKMKDTAVLKYLALVLCVLGSSNAWAGTTPPVSVPVNGGTLIAGALSGTTTNTGTISGGTSAPARVNLLSSIVGTGAASPSQSWLWQQGALSGTWTAGAGGIVSPYAMYITSDTVQSSISMLQIIDGVQAKAAGTHQGIATNVSVVGVPSSNNMTAVGGQFSASGHANMNGTGGATYTNWVGSLFGDNPQSIAFPGSTFLSRVTGTEIDASVETGASVAEFYGATVIATHDHQVRGSFDDAGIMLGEQSGANTFQTGLQFGNDANQWPLGPDGTIILARTRSVGFPQPIPIALNGVDFRNVNFAANGIEYGGPNFSVGNTGTIKVANATIKPVSTGMSIDIPSAAGWTATIGTAGNAYTNGDIVFDPISHAQATVVASGGVVSAVTITAPPVGTWTNPVAMSGGTGSGLSINFTSTLSNTLAIMSGGGTTTIGNGGFLVDSIGNVQVGAGNITSSGHQCLVAGQGNTCSSYVGIALGLGNVVSQSSSVSVGARAIDRGTTGQFSYASGYFALAGDSQWVTLAQRAISTGTTSVELTSDNLAPSGHNILLVPYGSAAFFEDFLVGGMDTSTFNTVEWKVSGLVLNRLATGLPLVAHTPTITQVEAQGTLSTAALSVGVDSNGGLAISATGVAGITLYIVGVPHAIEVQ
jgi:hypothetical protein